MTNETKVITFLLIAGVAYAIWKFNQASGSVAPVTFSNDNQQIAPYFMTYNQAAEPPAATTIAQGNAVAALNVASPQSSSIPSNQQVPASFDYCNCGG